MVVPVATSHSLTSPLSVPAARVGAIRRKEQRPNIFIEAGERADLLFRVHVPEVDHSLIIARSEGRPVWVKRLPIRVQTYVATW